MILETLLTSKYAGDAATANATQSANAGKISDVQGDIARITSRLDRLSLLNQALWELLREKTNLTDTDVLVRAKEIDLRDGQADGKIGMEILACPACLQPTNSRRNSCIYCGHAIQRSHIFAV